ncbi:hypothetical protein LAYK3_04760 [Lactobacillus amylovorus subsp. amylovorus]|nr:hypothetical protein LAYK3_04760 [Lactobacillus amylovorus]GMM22492.1 hypothetical protein LAYK10_18060 [Lactobacillus amylovorus]
MTVSKILLSSYYSEIGIGVTFPEGYGTDVVNGKLPVGSLVVDLR